MALAKIGFASKERTIMTQVWRSGRPGSQFPSSLAAVKQHCCCLQLMNFCPFNALSPSYFNALSPSYFPILLWDGLFYLCVHLVVSVLVRCTDSAPVCSHCGAAQCCPCDFLPDGAISCGVMVNIMDLEARLPGFKFQLSHILVVCCQIRFYLLVCSSLTAL